MRVADNYSELRPQGIRLYDLPHQWQDSICMRAFAELISQQGIIHIRSWISVSMASPQTLVQIS